MSNEIFAPGSRQIIRALHGERGDRVTGVFQQAHETEHVAAGAVAFVEVFVDLENAHI